MTDKPSFSVAVAGLDAQHLRLIEIVFRHIQYNRYLFRLVPFDACASADVLIAGVDDAEGRAALERARTLGAPRASISALGFQRPAPTRHAIEIADLVRQLLPILNRVVEIEGLAGGPRRVRDAAAAPDDDAAGGRGGAAARRVLVIDDSATVRAQLADAFGRMGLEVDPAASAGEALARLAAGPVDLAMLDLVLPDGDGLQLARRIRREPRWKRLPIVVLSARRSPLDVIRGAAAGCSAYLAKPVAFGDLRRTVADQLGRAVGADAMPAPLRAALEPR
jgi:CheY-like chemotaxis protein